MIEAAPSTYSGTDSPRVVTAAQTTLTSARHDATVTTPPSVTESSYIDSSQFANVRDSSRRGRHTKDAPRLAAVPAEIDTLVSEAHAKALQMLDCRSVIERELYFAAMMDRFRDLIDFRDHRERAFDKLVALVLGALDHRTSEQFTVDQVRAVQQVVDRVRLPRVDDLDLKDCRRFLRQAQLDPSRPLGGIFDAPST